MSSYINIRVDLFYFEVGKLRHWAIPFNIGTPLLRGPFINPLGYKNFRTPWMRFLEVTPWISLYPL